MHDAPPGVRALLTRLSASHSGVSIGDAVETSSVITSTSTRSARSPSASSSIRRISLPTCPGSVRMSTSSSTRSGMTFVFVPAVHDRRRERRVRARVRLTGEAEGQVVHELAERVRIEQRLLQLLRERHAFDEPAPHVVDHRLGPVLGDAAHDLGRVDERVVGAQRLRRVPGRAVHGQAAPVGALLADDDRKSHALRRWHRNAAGLRDDVVSLHRVELVLGEPSRAVRPERLLVGHGQVDERALGPPAGRREVASWPPPSRR